MKITNLIIFILIFLVIPYSYLNSTITPIDYQIFVESQFKKVKFINLNNVTINKITIKVKKNELLYKDKSRYHHECIANEIYELESQVDQDIYIGYWSNTVGHYNHKIETKPIILVDEKTVQEDFFNINLDYKDFPELISGCTIWNSGYYPYNNEYSIKGLTIFKISLKKGFITSITIEKEVGWNQGSGGSGGSDYFLESFVINLNLLKSWKKKIKLFDCNIELTPNRYNQLIKKSYENKNNYYFKRHTTLVYPSSFELNNNYMFLSYTNFEPDILVIFYENYSVSYDYDDTNDNKNERIQLKIINEK